MFSVFKQGRKVTFDYLIFLIIYVAFLPLVVSLAKENTENWTPVYSLFVGMLMFLVIWSDVYDTARKEKKPVYNLNPSPHKGFIIGLLGFAPYALLTVAAFIFTSLKGQEIGLTPELVDLITDAFIAPLYFLVRLFNRSAGGYVAVFFFIPSLCYLAYYCGNKGITKKGITKSIKDFFKLNGKDKG